ncbi:MAG TPA: hypothetical protein VFE58_12165 [Tepidisphaeraceae bacterium]|nr:hypothetical protein [Tepidisphaeraceae bacterium]
MPKPKRRRLRTWKAPPELARIRESFTDPQMRSDFEKFRGRPPQSDAELEVWFEQYTIGIYNSGRAFPPQSGSAT